MKNLLRLMFVAFLIGSFMSCEDESTPPVGDPDPIDQVPATVEEQQALISGANEFCFELFKRTAAAEEDGKNVFISPFSVSMAFSMLNNGAVAGSRTAITETLGFQDLTIDQINSAYRDVYDNLQDVDPAVQFSIANSIWHDDTDIQVFDDFIETNEVYYDAAVSVEDFRNTATVDLINAWVEDKTNGKINTILEEIAADEVMFLLNAIYFKGLWATPFDPEDTQDGAFMTEAGVVENVEMMKESNMQRAVYSSEDYKAVEMAYGDSLFTMTLIRPDEGISADDLAESFSLEEWTTLKEGLALQPYSNSELSLPKLDLAYEVKYKDILSAMGLQDLFTSAANLTDIGNAAGHLYLSKVKHKTYLKLDEAGTEAAAVTSIGVAVESMPQALRFNKPFLMVLSERNSGTILFIGKIENPTI